MTLDSSDFKRGLKSASGVATSFSKTTSSAFDSVDDEATGAARAVSKFKRAMLGVGGAATSIIVPTNRAAGAIDNAGDEAQGTSRSFGVLSLSSTGLSASFGILTASATSLAGALGLITIALTPLIGVLATATAAFGAIAAIFGVILGSGIAAYMKETGTSVKSLVKTVKQAVLAFGKQFIPLIKDAVALLPSLIKRISNAVGSLDPFVHALRVLGTIAYNVLPPLIGLFFDLAKAALPFFLKAAKFIGKNLVPALRALFQAGQRAAGEVYRLAKGLFNVAKSLAGLAGWVGRFVVALYDLAAAALGVGKLTKELKRVGQVIRQGLQGAFQWLSTTGVKLAKQAFSAVADAAIAAFDFAKTELVPAIKTGLSMAWHWVRTKGVAHAKSALGFLADKALAALEFTKQEIIPAISTGLGKAWNWIRTKGKKKAKKAFGFLADKALAAFEFTKQEIIPAVKSGLGKAWHWIKTKGKKKARDVFKFLSDKAIAAFEFTKKQVIPKVREFVETATHWIRTKGKKKLKSAMEWLAKKSVAGFKLGKKYLLPKIKKGVRQAGVWIETKGVKIIAGAFHSWVANIKKAPDALMNAISSSFKTGIPKLRDWLAKNGVRIIKDAFFAIGRGIRNAIGAMFKIGGFIGKALQQGMKDLSDWLSKSGKKQFTGAFKDIGDGIVHYLRNQFNTDLHNAIDFVLDAVMAAFEGFYTGLTGNKGALFPSLGNAIAIDITGWNIDATVSSVLHDAWMEIQAFGSNALGTVQTFFGQIITYFKTDFLTDVKQALAEAARQAVQTFKQVFNSKIPDNIPIPSVSIAGRTFGGGSIPLPELHSGGTVTQTGLFVLEAGETVVPGEADMPYSGSGGGSQEVTVAIDVRGDSELARMIERHIEANEQKKDRAIDRARSSFGGS